MLVDINDIEGLDGIELRPPEGLKLGALRTLARH